MPVLDLKTSDYIRFTLGGKPVSKATIAAARVKTIDAKPGPRKGQFDLVVTLVVAGKIEHQLDALRFNSEAELWAGLAEFAAGKLADLALEMHAREENESRSGRAGR